MKNQKVICCFLRRLSVAVPLEGFGNNGDIVSIKSGSNQSKGLYVTNLHFKVTFPNELLESKSLETDNADFTVAVVAEYGTNTDTLLEMARADLNEMFNQDLTVVHDIVPPLFP